MARIRIMNSVLSLTPHRRRVLLLAALTFAAMC